MVGRRELHEWCLDFVCVCVKKVAESTGRPSLLFMVKGAGSRRF